MEQTTDLKEFLTEIAEAIRIQRGEYDELYSPQEFAEKILDIETGTGTDTSGAAIETLTGTINAPHAFGTPPQVFVYTNENLQLNFMIKEKGDDDSEITIAKNTPVVKIDCELAFSAGNVEINSIDKIISMLNSYNYAGYAIFICIPTESGFYI